MKKEELTDKHWEFIFNKWGKLLHKMSHSIKGDSKADNEDYYNDFVIHTIKVVKAYSKREDKTIDEFLDTEEFNKFYKTCLWNYKNGTGKNVQKRYNLNGNYGTRWELDAPIDSSDSGANKKELFRADRDLVSNFNFDVFDIEDYCQHIGGSDLTDNDRIILREIINNPNLYCETNNRLNIEILFRETKLKRYQIKKSLDNLKEVIGNNE